MRRLESDIATGRLTPGERLAPERDLGARFDVARNTLRRALRDLAARGLIEARDRSGWFVNGRGVTIETVSGPQGLTEWAAIHGLTVSSRVVVARVRPADEVEAEALRIPVASQVFELERVRVVEGAPLSLDRSILVPAIAEAVAGLDFATRSLFQSVRERNGIEPSRAECLIRAITTDRRTAELMGLAEGDPLLELSETVYDQFGDPFEYGTHLNRGDRYAFRTTIRAGGVWDGPT
jgi:GntR family transcriptional regulator